MSTYARWLATAAIMVSCFACGGDDDGDEPGGDGDRAGDGPSGGSNNPAARAPTEEEINAALADAGIFFDDSGVTIGDSRIDYGPDGIRWDDASVVSINDGGIVLGSGDASFTIRTEGTCAELLACCETLSDEAKNTECTMTHANLMAIPLGVGDLLCANFVAGFCP